MIKYFQFSLITWLFKIMIKETYQLTENNKFPSDYNFKHFLKTVLKMFQSPNDISASETNFTDDSKNCSIKKQWSFFDKWPPLNEREHTYFWKAFFQKRISRKNINLDKHVCGVTPVSKIHICLSIP